MTFGEKIQALRKESGLSQEDLSERLGVSRQAVSKWERDQGYPETEKIVHMSRIFHVTLDHLLNEEAALERPKTDGGVSVSRDMAHGFLSYQKRKYFKTALAVGTLLGGLSLSFLPYDGSLPFMLILIFDLVLWCSVKLSDDPYRDLWREPLRLDETVRAELQEVYAKKKKPMQGLRLVGITLMALGFLFFPILVPAELAWANTLAECVGMLAAGAGAFLCVYLSGVIRAYRRLVTGEPHPQNRK